MKIVNKKRFIVSSIGLAFIIILVIVIIAFNVYNPFGKNLDEKQVQKTQVSQEEVMPDATPIKEESEAENVKPDNSEREKTGPDGIFQVGSINQIVNRNYPLAADYVPSDMVWLDLPGTRDTQMRAEAVAALTKLFEAAQAQGLDLYCSSGYRSYGLQEELYDGYVATYGQEEADLFSAKPGTSEHQTGLVMDVTCESVAFDLLESFGQTKEGAFVRDHAHEYGFIIRYPQGKTSSTGYSYEPWHIRYLGVALATEVKNSGKTLEEYYGL